MAEALSGIRVLDLGMFWAAPATASLLADMGAEVIKIEACRHPDPDRIAPQGLAYADGDPGPDPWNRGLLHLRRHRNKLGCTLDLTTPEGREVFLRLARLSDVVVENFRVGVLDRWGLGYPVLKEANPALILVSVSSQGYSGPEREYGSNASVVSFTGGLRSLTGYLDGIGHFAEASIPDPMAGVLAAGFLMAALRHRRRTGRGLHLVLSQREMVTAVIGEAVMDYMMNGRVQGPQGNRHPSMAPHGCYPCQGDDRWVTIAVRSDAQWQRLCQALGRPELASDPRFADASSRWHHQDELDALLASWTRQYQPQEVMRRLQEQGIAAGAVYTARDILEDPHLQARGFWERVEDPHQGSIPFKGRGFFPSKTPGGTRSPAPRLGEHNRLVYGDLLGLSAEEIARLEEKGIIGTVPSAEVRARVPSREAISP